MERGGACHNCRQLTPWEQEQMRRYARAFTSGRPPGDNLTIYAEKSQPTATEYAPSPTTLNNTGFGAWTNPFRRELTQQEEAEERRQNPDPTAEPEPYQIYEDNPGDDWIRKRELDGINYDQPEWKPDPKLVKMPTSA